MTKYSHAKLERGAIKRKIQRLLGLDLQKVSQDYVRKLIRDLLGRHGYITRPLNIQNPIAYGVRINNGLELFENTSDLWYPPAKYVKRGRCNEPEEPVFYFSDSEDTAVIEKAPKDGDILTVLTCELADVKNLPLVMHLGINEHTAVMNPRYGGTPPDQDEKQKAFIQQEGLSKTNPIIHKFLTGEFLKEVPEDSEDEYKITSAIADILINEPETLTEDGLQVVDNQVDGIAYPSIASHTFGANVALRAEAADQLYRPTSCTAYQVVAVHDRLHYTLGKVCWSKSIDATRHIEWEIPTTNHKELTDAFLA